MTASNDCDDQELFSLSKFGEDILTQWFRLDQWKPKEAICLLCNIVPNLADIEWNFKPKGYTLGPALVTVRNAGLLSEGGVFYGVPTDRTTDGDKTQYSPSTIKEKAKKLNKTELQLQTVWSMFNRASDFEFDGVDSSSPASYLKWAKDKGIPISWLDWAIHQGFIEKSGQSEASSNEEPIDFRPITAKGENTYLNIIGGLLGIMLCESSLGKPNSVFKTQSDVINSLLSKYAGNQGITKRTLEEKFAAAKRSIQHNN